MKTLKEIKDQVANKYGKSSWSELLYWGSSYSGFQFPEAIDDVAIEYAAQTAHQALDDAASRVTYKRGSMEIDTDSITNTPIKTP